MRKDRARFLELLEGSLGRFRASLHPFILMGNHYHLLAQTELPNLGRWMHVKLANTGGILLSGDL